MKVWAVNGCVNYGMGLFIVAAYSVEEAIFLAENDPISCDLEDFEAEQLQETEYNGDSPCILARLVYEE